MENYGKLWKTIENLSYSLENYGKLTVYELEHQNL